MQTTEAMFLAAVALFLLTFCLLGLFHYEYSTTLLRFPILAAGVTLVLVFSRLLLHLERKEKRKGRTAQSLAQTVLAAAFGTQASAPNCCYLSLGVLDCAPGFHSGMAVWIGRLSALACSGGSVRPGCFPSLISVFFPGRFLRTLHYGPRRAAAGCPGLVAGRRGLGHENTAFQHWLRSSGRRSRMLSALNAWRSFSRSKRPNGSRRRRSGVDSLRS